MIRGQTRPLPVATEVENPSEIKAKFNASIHNRFDIEVVDAKTGEIKQRAQAENVICNSLWQRLAACAKENGVSPYFSSIHYGSGSGTPAATNTSLFTFVGAKTPTATAVVTKDLSTRTRSAKKYITIGETENVGVTLTEVGIGYDTSSGSLVTHAMLKDMNGNQISISKTNTDIINIYATVFVHWRSSYLNGSFDMMTSSATEYDFLNYCLGIHNSFNRTGCYLLPVEAETSSPYGGVTSSTDNKTITVTYSRIGATSANELPSLGIMIKNTGFLGVKDGGGILPTSIVGESIGTGDGTTKKFKTKFDMATITKVYVNGVEDTSAIKRTDAKIYPTKMSYYMHRIDANGNLIKKWMPNLEFDYDVGTTRYYYNPYYSEGLKEINGSGSFAISASNDLVTWSEIGTTNTIPDAYKNYKYWKLVKQSSSYSNDNITGYGDGYCVEFATAPPSGAVITADYITKTIPKDENHVFDFVFSIIFGEYTGA